jgi:hypothetical protein
VPNQHVEEEVEQLLARRQSELTTTRTAATAFAASSSSCTAGPIARGFDRPGGDGTFSIMARADGTNCSGTSMLNTTGCAAEDCAAKCCGLAACRSWVHGIAPGCDTAGHDASAVCCWIKTSNPQLAVKAADHLSTGEVAGHGAGGGTAPPPGPVSPPAPPAPLPPAGKTFYSTLVFTYEWPAADTPTSSNQWRGGSLTARLEELSALLQAGLVTQAEHDAARKAALGI